jgi:hypothetical protein
VHAAPVNHGDEAVLSILHRVGAARNPGRARKTSTKPTLDMQPHAMSAQVRCDSILIPVMRTGVRPPSSDRAGARERWNVLSIILAAANPPLGTHPSTANTEGDSISQRVALVFGFLTVPTV